MSVVNDLFNAAFMGEPERLDYVIEEHKKLQARVAQLEELLKSKGIVTTQELNRLERLAAKEQGE